jgi:class 3 adenylate cyclase
MYTEATLLPLEKITAVETALEERANIMAFNFVIVPELSFLGDTYFSFVLDPQVVKNSGDTFFVFSEGDWETAMPILESTCGVLLPPLTAQKNDAGLGEPLSVTGKYGPVECTIAGIGPSFVLASIIGDVVADQFVTGDPFGLYITPKPGIDVESLEADIDTLMDELSLETMSTRSYVDMMMEVYGQIRAMFHGMLLLAMIIAALAVVNTTLMSITERRREFGLLRAVGAERRQISTIVALEAYLVGLIGGILGLVAGVGFSIILVLVYGGNSWGYPELEIWPTAWQVSLTTLQTAVFGLVVAPFIAAGAAWLPARNLTSGTPIETLSPQEPRQTVRHLMGGWWMRGSIRTRFVLGTGVLLIIVLAAIVGFVSNHAQNRMQEHVESMVISLATWNARALEAALPDDADTISLENLQTGQLDAESMLRFQAISEDVGENILEEFVIVNKDGYIILSLDPRAIGGLHTPSETEDPAELERGLILVNAPIRNATGTLVGSIHLTVKVTQIDEFLTRFQSTMWLAGGAIILLSLLLIAWLSTPLIQMTRQLVTQASEISLGRFTPVRLPDQAGWRAWLSQRTSLKTRLTVAMVLAVVVMVGVLELIVVPTERQQLETLLKDNIVSGGEWMGQIISKNFESLPVDVDEGFSLDQMMQMMGAIDGFDLVQLQDLTEQARGDMVAYTTFVDMEGNIILSDRLALVGEKTSIPSQTTVEDDIWWDESIWAVSIPLNRGEDGDQVGAMRLGVRRVSLESFLQESRLLLRLFGVVAVLSAVLLAQAIGGAVTHPVQQLAADTRRVADGDLTVQFRVDTKDELAVLATAFNQMVAGLREREWLRDMFGRFVSQEVADAIRAGQVRLEGENRVVSVLFCDIRGFTARSERHTPEQIVALLNEYLPVVVDAAQVQGGTVNKFGGDSTLVIYGAPKQLQESAYRAVLTALQMRKDLAALNEQLISRGEDPIQIGVGINTGAALAGAVGPEARQEYTVIGDTVNLASRIEALNKEYPQYDILISGETYQALGSRRREFECIDLGNISIRGKQEGVQVWAVVTRLGGI